MCRFYSISPKDYFELDTITANNLVKAIEPIEAKELLGLIIATSYPNLEERNRKSLISSLQKMANVSPVVKKEMSNEALAQWLKGALGG